MLSRFSRVQLFAAPLSMGLPRQDYWSRLPYPPLGDLPSLGIEPESLVSPALAGEFFTTVPTGEVIKTFLRALKVPGSSECLLLGLPPRAVLFSDGHPHSDLLC